MLLTPNLLPVLASIAPIHLDADFPVPVSVNPTNVQRASDHDPVQLRLRPVGVGMLGGNLRYADISVQLVDGRQAMITATRTDALGDFRLWNVTSGAYHLRFATPRYLLPALPEIDLSVTTGYNTLGAHVVRHRTVDLAAAMALVAANMAGPIWA